MFIYVKSDTKNEQKIDRLKKLSQQLSLPLCSDNNTASYYLTYQNSRLELHENKVSRTSGPILVDFLSGHTAYRFHHNRTISQPLARAVGIKKGYRPTVCDLTAGFGNDGFVLASLGCKVILVERSPVIWALLADGIIRGKSAHGPIGETIRNNILLFRAESHQFIKDDTHAFETIYLDPMYPQTNRRALSKRNIRVIRDLVGKDEDCAELLILAQNAATERVVVKRPHGAPYLGSEKPSCKVESKKHRYDIYLCPHL